jgi:hypothetical protein
VVTKPRLGTLHPQFGDPLQRDQSSTVSINNAALSEVEAGLSRELYYALLLLMQQNSTPMEMVQSVGEGQGAEAWRLLWKEFEPRMASRTAVEMSDIVSFQFEGDIPAAIGHFNAKLQHYKSITGREVEDDVLIGVLLKGMKDLQIRRHLILNASAFPTYKEAQAEVVRVWKAERSVSGLEKRTGVALTQETSAPTPSAPMEVDMFYTYKSAKGAGGKGKGGCYLCGGDHFARDCPGQENRGGADSFIDANECEFCGRQGHVMRKCYDWLRAAAQVRARVKGKGKGRGKAMQVMETVDRELGGDELGAKLENNTRDPQRFIFGLGVAGNTFAAQYDEQS